MVSHFAMSSTSKTLSRLKEQANSTAVKESNPKSSRNIVAEWISPIFDPVTDAIALTIVTGSSDALSLLGLLWH